MLTTFSFGAGVQSTAIMLLIKHDPDLLLKVMGELPSVAFFADTQAEPYAVYAHIERLIQYGLPIPLKIVSRGSVLAAGDGLARSFAPYFTRNANGEVAMLRRKCTNQFKIEPIENAIREELGLVRYKRSKPESVHHWIGISLDEADRMKPARKKMMVNRYPLVDLRWSRSKCQEYNLSHGLKAPKSRCFFCPFVSDWESIRKNEPDEFQRAVEFDRQIRKPHAGFQREAYLHRLCIPLDEAVEAMARKRSAREGSPNLFPDFAEECGGHCGV